MLKTFYLFLIILISPVVIFAQEDESQKESGVKYGRGDVFVGISSGLDYDINAYRTSSDYKGYSFEERNPHFNIGAYWGVMVTDKLRPRLEVKYVRTSHKQVWPSGRAYEYTYVQLNNLDLNLHFDYLLFHNDKWNVFISPAFKSEFYMSEDYDNYDADGDKDDSKFSELDYFYPKSVAGGALSFMFKYDVNEFWGLTFTPEYTYFFRPYHSSNSEAYQRFNLNVGVEFRFR